MPFDDAHALAIGISAYQHVSPLRPTRDAQDLAAALRDPSLCGYPPQNVQLLMEGEATRAAVLQALEALRARTSPSSTVFLYFSGHGARARAATSSPSYYLVPVDADATSSATLERTAISGAEFTAQVSRIAAARLTVVLDCCRAAELADADLALAPAELSAEVLGPLAQGRGRAVLAASRGDGSAYSLPGAEHSVFTGHLLRGLRGEAAATGGVIRICDLFHHVQQATSAEQAAQRPVFKAELEENYPVALAAGGAALQPTLPPPPDAAPHDAFISCCAADRPWVKRVLVPYLEQRGLRLFLEHRDFLLGAPRLTETERGVAESRYTVTVFSPAYLASAFEDYQALLAAHAAAESGLPRFIPLVRQPCALRLHRRMTEALDVSVDDEVPAALERLALALRQLPRPRLSA